MKQLVRNYAINLANKEVTLNDFVQVYLDRLRLITDVSTNTILYNFADSSVASVVSLGTKSFYLNSLPATTATLDALEIDYEVIPGDPTYDAGINVSLQGTPGINASIQGTPNVAFAAGATVTANQGTSPWLVNASIIGNPGVNASIQGTVPVSGNVGLGANTTLTAFQGGSPWGVNASIIGTPGVNASIQGSVGVVGTFWQATQPVSGNITVTVTGDLPVSGTFWQANQAVTASIAGQVPVTASIAGIVTVAGNFSVSSSPTVTALQGNAPWLANASVAGLAFDGSGNLLTNLAGNVSIGTPTVNQGTSPWVVNATQAGAWTVAAHNVSIAGNITLGSLNINNLGPGANIGNVVVSLGANATLGFPVNIITAINQPVTASLVGTPNVALAASSTITAYQGASPWIVNASIQGTVPVSGIPGTGATLTAYQGAPPWTANVSVQGTPSVNQGTNPWVSTLTPGTGGWSSYASAGISSLVSISHTAGEFGGYMLMNLNSAPAYLQVFDATGNVTLGLTVPNIIIPLPNNSTAANGLAANMELANGAQLANGLKAAVTTTATGASIVATALAGTIWYH